MTTSSPLSHPIRDPNMVVTSQRWGENPQAYARLGIPGHAGWDIAGVQGTPIVAVADGIVAFVGVDVDYGNYCRVRHEQLGFQSFYAHLFSVHPGIRVGHAVARGQEIGRMGSTGNSTGPHLHYECRIANGDSYIELTDGYGKGRVNPMIVYWLLNREII